jgi:hypothetical protein
MDWFGWQPLKDRANKTARSGPQALLLDLDKRVPRYLDDADQGRLIYPACKRTPSDQGGDIATIWDHTRLEATRYLTMVPAREYALLAEPARQPEIIDAYLRQRPHEDIVVEFTGVTTADLAIAAVAGINWLTHCATLVDVNREQFTGTLSTFRKIASLARQWWSMDGAEARCAQMLGEQQTPPLMLYLVWQEYTRLAKEISSAARFGSSIERAMDERRKLLLVEFSGRPAELETALAALSKTVTDLESAREPDDLGG